MASAFWFLEDGRGFSQKWTGMSTMLGLISEELKKNQGAGEFQAYFDYYVCREENGDVYNGYGGFIRANENILFNFDLRTFTRDNRMYFWLAAQRALTKLRVENPEAEGLIYLFTQLLDMHKRIKRGENPMLLNNLRIVQPDPEEKRGPGW
jgi:hypothetical protein